MSRLDHVDLSPRLTKAQENIGAGMRRRGFEPPAARKEWRVAA